LSKEFLPKTPYPLQLEILRLRSLRPFGRLRDLDKVSELAKRELKPVLSFVEANHAQDKL
jgi:hypothetical protein